MSGNPTYDLFGNPDDVKQWLRANRNKFKLTQGDGNSVVFNSLINPNENSFWNRVFKKHNFDVGDLNEFFPKTAATVSTYDSLTRDRSGYAGAWPTEMRKGGRQSDRKSYKKSRKSYNKSRKSKKSYKKSRKSRRYRR